MRSQFVKFVKFVVKKKKFVVKKKKFVVKKECKKILTTGVVPAVRFMFLAPFKGLTFDSYISCTFQRINL